MSKDGVRAMKCSRGGPGEASIGCNLIKKHFPGVLLSALAPSAQGRVNCRGADTAKGCLPDGGRTEALP